jgi:hypothetical protein
MATPLVQAEYEADIPLRESLHWDLYRFSEFLEDYDIRHSITPDAIIAALGYPLIICTLYLTIADKQLEDALTVFLEAGCQESEGPGCYVSEDATDNPLGCPGYNFRLSSSPIMAPCLVFVPSSF